MSRLVICALLSVVALEVAGNGTVIGASDGGPQSAG